MSSSQIERKIVEFFIVIGCIFSQEKCDSSQFIFRTSFFTKYALNINTQIEHQTTATTNGPTIKAPPSDPDNPILYLVPLALNPPPEPYSYMLSNSSTISCNTVVPRPSPLLPAPLAHCIQQVLKHEPGVGIVAVLLLERHEPKLRRCDLCSRVKSRRKI